MEIKDNRDLFKKTKEERQAPYKCRVCGADDHFTDYNAPTMDCIKYLRSIITQLYLEAGQVEKEANPLGFKDLEECRMP